ncbi:MAG: ABC transporter permease [Pseudomonadota bacterium]
MSAAATARGSAVAELARAFLRDRTASAGLAILALTGATALLAPVLAPFGPDEATPSLRLAPPLTPGHPLGLDHQGRDVLSRILHGAQLTLLTGLAPVIAGALVAIPLGLVAAWYERIGAVIMLAMDVLFAFPMALLAILVTSSLGPGMINLLLSLVIVLLPYNVRVVHQAAAAQKALPYVEALRACGTPVRKILFVELLPNVAPAAIVYGATVLGSIVVTAAGLSFLGLGVQPPHAEWGVMIAEGRNVVFLAPHVAALPGLALTLLVIACNLLGDGVRDALDPRTRATLGHRGDP